MFSAKQEREGKKRKSNKKGPNTAGKLWKSTRKRYYVGVQVDGKGPRTLCYSTSYDAASAVHTSKNKKKKGSKEANRTLA